jgi:hypothetical protein
VCLNSLHQESELWAVRGESDRFCADLTCQDPPQTAARFAGGIASRSRLSVDHAVLISLSRLAWCWQGLESSCCCCLGPKQSPSWRISSH